MSWELTCDLQPTLEGPKRPVLGTAVEAQDVPRYALASMADDETSFRSSHSSGETMAGRLPDTSLGV